MPRLGPLCRSQQDGKSWMRWVLLAVFWAMFGPQVPGQEPDISYFVQPRSVGTRRETEPPRYVRTLSESLALRGYGVMDQSGFDFDLHAAFQVGHDGPQSHRTFGMTSEVGYTFDHQWQPRISGFFGYATGDRDPEDGRSDRIDRLFGFGRPWSASDYFFWQNLIAPKVRLDLRLRDDVTAEMGYGAFWLASSRDRWASTGLQDSTGESGSFLGQELDIRIRFPLTPRIDVTLGYVYFLPGSFTAAQGRGDDTSFFYVETYTRLLK